MPTELRCDSGNLHGIITDEGYLEVRCSNRLCGHRSGHTVVFHYYSTQTGVLVKTRKFRDASKLKNKEDGVDAHRILSTAVRSA